MNFDHISADGKVPMIVDRFDFEISISFSVYKFFLLFY